MHPRHPLHRTHRPSQIRSPSSQPPALHAPPLAGPGLRRRSPVSLVARRCRSGSSTPPLDSLAADPGPQSRINPNPSYGSPDGGEACIDAAVRSTASQDGPGWPRPRTAAGDGEVDLRGSPDALDHVRPAWGISCRRRPPAPPAARYNPTARVARGQHFPDLADGRAALTPRRVLLLYIIKVHYKLELLGETLFLTVNIIDRYLARENGLRKKLQLVGVTAMLLACKYEEVSVPVMEDLILICDRAYTRSNILEMERTIVDRLKFDMSVPTPYCFMRRLLKAAKSYKKLELLSFFSCWMLKL